MTNKEFINLTDKEYFNKTMGTLWYNYTVENDIKNYTLADFEKWLDKECDEARATAILKEQEKNEKKHIQEMGQKIGLKMGTLPIKGGKKN